MKRTREPFLVRRRIYIALELRQSFRKGRDNKSKSRALKAVTFREGDEAPPSGFYRDVAAKLESFGDLSRAEQLAAMKQVRSYLSEVLSRYSG
jgi:hypothetical protein